MRYLWLTLVAAAVASLLSACGGSSVPPSSGDLSPPENLYVIDHGSVPTTEEAAPYRSNLQRIANECDSDQATIANYTAAVIQKVQKDTGKQLSALEEIRNFHHRADESATCQEQFAADGVALESSG